MVVCPLCSKQIKNLYFHMRNNHMEELERHGYPKFKQMAKQKDASGAVFDPPVGRPSPVVPGSESPMPDAPVDRQMDAHMDTDMSTWGAEVGPKVYFRMTPASAFMIRMFAKKRDPSDVINSALLEYGRSRGVEPAIIKSQGGEQFTLVRGDGADEDKEFKRLLQLIAANSQVNQSYSQNSPAIQMMQMMREKVGRGMNMGEFMKELMSLRMQESMSARNQPNGFLMALMMMRKNRRRR